MNKWLRKAAGLVRPFQVTNGRRFQLSSIDPADTRGFESKRHARAQLARGIQILGELQERLWAQDQWSVLLIFQAMDAAGKDSVIKHVMSGINPQGCDVHSFRAPSEEELRHNYLWRAIRALPERGRIGIFNRSYYEEVLIVRVHPNLLDAQRIPPELMPGDVWKQRFADIRIFEDYLLRHGTIVLKFFLNVSKDEQRERFLSRIDEPNKNWKFSMNDVSERQHWDEYMHAYEDMIQHTAFPEAPWYVVPADHKWFTRVVVVSAILEALSSLNLAFPTVEPDRLKELGAARVALANESAPGRAQAAGRRREST